ncbi:MAG TPA: hypothetical protein VK807_23285 [Gemmatimonadaceae bacterium]|nr:hypothetical protein [Gemmatimonadaceae bacterium]
MLLFAVPRDAPENHPDHFGEKRREIEIDELLFARALEIAALDGLRRRASRKL